MTFDSFRVTGTVTVLSVRCWDYGTQRPLVVERDTVVPLG